MKLKTIFYETLQFFQQSSFWKYQRIWIWLRFSDVTHIQNRVAILQTAFQTLNIHQTQYQLQIDNSHGHFNKVHFENIKKKDQFDCVPVTSHIFRIGYQYFKLRFKRQILIKINLNTKYIVLIFFSTKFILKISKKINLVALQWRYTLRIKYQYFKLRFKRQILIKINLNNKSII